MLRDSNTPNVGLLAACQALANCCNVLMVAIAALVGQNLAPDPSLATLPFALQFVGIMATTVPASLVMSRFGRRYGFSQGAVIGIAAGVICSLAVFDRSFMLYCFGSLIYGVFAAHASYYRFAAADAAKPEGKAQAISLVLAGGIVAAIAGPQLATWSRDLLAPVFFAGSFLVVSALSFLVLLVVQFIRIPNVKPEAVSKGGRSLSEIARQPAFIVAVLAGMIGYGSMNLIMLATPLAMLACNHSFSDSNFVISWHVLSMFAPSFFTGSLVRRFGVEPILLTGGLLILACVAINLSGVEILQFWSALVMLGLGWNFLYVGGSILLTSTHRPEEQAKVQALNEFLTFSVVAVTALGSGALLHYFGWDALNLGVLVPVLLVITSVLWFWRRKEVAIPQH
ncbi:MFS transporter [Denitrobaculum tricleocarpae]|uniref:MFS transporter n=1 Tax=Denitrobaculum tricleocarpae TaxID=2591009 RepID=A0A545TTD0_9PROT|nr:MFS transporter [Denitrobaculum tricleocarpae]TQV80478.1 MFS transporter [Denitrobaculum tricleocarpae]